MKRNLWLSILVLVATSYARSVFAQSDAVPNVSYKGKRLEISAQTFFGLDSERSLAFHIHDDQADPKLNVKQHGVGPEEGQDEHDEGIVAEGVDVLDIERAFQVTALSARYRLSPGTMLTVDVPFVRRQDVLRFNGDALRFRRSGLGDIRLGLYREKSRTGRGRVDVTTGLTLRLPTGKSTFDNADDFKPSLGTGFTEIGGEVNIVKMRDPMVVNLGFGVGYNLPKKHNGANLQPGMNYYMQTGLSYALSDRLVVSEHLTFVSSNNVFLTAPGQPATSKTKEAYVTHGFIYHLRQGGPALRLSLSVGLNQPSVDKMLRLELVSFR